MISTKLHQAEFKIFRVRPELAGQILGSRHRVLVAVSGGADSIALLHILAKLRDRWGFRLSAAYVHHGKTSDAKQALYRDRAQKTAEKTAKQLKIEFNALEVSAGLKSSEEALRKLRLTALQKHAHQLKAGLIAMGHHQDDVLETRLIRLIRGTGPQGLQAMTSLSEMPETKSELQLWRPLLTTSRADIEVYLRDQGLRKSKDWVEDPSNRDTRYLRNAIRHKVLPLIEKIRPGGTEAMGRSLDLVVEVLQSSASSVTPPPQQEALDRAELLALSPENRRKCLANWLHGRKIKGISKSHIEEALKRIDTPRKRLSFETGGCTWTVERSIRVQLKQRSI